jgi:hypothetical protein
MERNVLQYHKNCINIMCIYIYTIMPVRNGYKSHNGRSAVARKVLRGGAGKVNGMMPQKEVWTLNAGYVNGNTYFGGPKKGGLAPTARFSTYSNRIYET